MELDKKHMYSLYIVSHACGRGLVIGYLSVLSSRNCSCSWLKVIVDMTPIKERFRPRLES